MARKYAQQLSNYDKRIKHEDNIIRKLGREREEYEEKRQNIKSRIGRVRAIIENYGTD